MATDIEKLVVQLSADIKQYEREMRKAVGVSQKQARAIEKRYQQMDTRLNKIGRSAAHSIITPLAGIGAALSVREVARYADAWTVAGNKIASASQIAGMQSRSLEGLNEIADETRSGISETVDLYAKLLRSTAGVAQSEMEVARATEIVNKAFKAGGAAASEQAAGILQLSQGLGSGLLQGDELRSVRENAPILAQAIADYYKVSIAGLKELGAEGKITSEGVFRAILAAQGKVEAAFATTNATIQDGVTRVNNAFTQYIGQTDAGLSASQRLVAGLTALADNFDQVADVTLKVASIFASGLLGRSIGGMIAKLGLAGAALTKFFAAARAASSISGIATAIGGLSAAAGPLGILLGTTAATAMVLYSDASRDAEERTNRLKGEMEDLGLYAPQAAAAIDQVTTSIDDLTDAQRLRKVKEIREELERLRSGSLLGSVLGGGDNLPAIREEALLGRKDAGAWGSDFERGDKDGLAEVENVAVALMQGTISAQELKTRLEALGKLDLSDPAKALVARLQDAGSYTVALAQQQEALGDSPALRDANDQLQGYRDHLDNISQAQFAPPVIGQIVEIIDEFQNGERSADDAKAAIDKLGETAPGFAGLISNVLNAIGVLESLRAKAVETASAVAAAGGDRPGRGDGAAEVARRRADAAAAKAGSEFIAEQERLQGLTKDQLALEKEMASVRKDAQKAGATLTEEQIRGIAAANIAADDRRTASGKTGGKSSADKATERYDDAILKEIEGMRAEAGALNELALGQDEYGSAVAAARKEAELLQQLQNKGVPITAELATQVRSLTDKWKEADIALTVAQGRHEEFQAALEDFRSTISDAFSGLITGAYGFNDALGMVMGKLAELALSKGFDRLWEGNGSGGGLSGPVGSFLKAVGFDDGGYTGPGGKRQPAGIVHKGEVVWSQRDVRRAGGVGLVEALRRSGGRMPGYADGGVVAASAVPASSMIPALDRRSRGRPTAISLSQSFSVDARGAQRGAAEEFARVIQEMRPQLRKDAVEAMYMANRERPLR